MFDGLFAKVAASGLFSDFKDFADAVPRAAPGVILAAYRAQNPQSKAALAAFVRKYFALQPPAATTLPQKGLAIEDHIAALWPILTRNTPTVPAYSSALPLPQPYVVPGGRFTEMYYWDSYFTMLGLRDAKLRGSMVANFAYMIDAYGHIPNGSRTYYLSRSQPPFFFKMVSLTEKDDEAAAFARFLPELKAEYAYWMTGEQDVGAAKAVRNVVVMPNGAILNRYWDDRDTPRDEMFPKDVAAAKTSSQPKDVLYRNIRAAAESGWDFSSRWFADDHALATIETTNIIPVDLNSLLFGLEQAIAAGCAKKKDLACAREFAGRAARRRAAINRYLWDAKTGTFFDYDWSAGKRRDVLSAAMLYPLFVGETDAAQARGVADTVPRPSSRSGRCRHHRQPHRSAMGRAERLGAAAMDRGRGSASLRSDLSRDRNRFALARNCRARLRRLGPPRRKIRRRESEPQRRRRRIQAAGRLRLDERRDGGAPASLSLGGRCEDGISRQCSLAAHSR